MIAAGSWAASRAASSISLRPASAPAQLDQDGARPGHRQGPVGLVQPSGLDRRLVGESKRLPRVRLYEPIGQLLHNGLASHIRLLVQQRQGGRRVGLGQVPGLGESDFVVVAMALIGRPPSGEFRIDLGHVLDATKRPVVVCVRDRTSPRAGPGLAGRRPAARRSSALCAGFHAGGGSSVLSSVMERSSASSSALTPVKRYPSLRTKTYLVPGNRPSSRNRPWGSVEVATGAGPSPRLNTAAPAIGRPSEPTTRPARCPLVLIRTILPTSRVSPALPVTFG